MGLNDLEKKIELEALIAKVAVSITLNPQKRFLLFSLYEDETTSKLCFFLFFFCVFFLNPPSLSLSVLQLKIQKRNKNSVIV